jgi:hypothetical protein
MEDIEISKVFDIDKVLFKDGKIIINNKKIQFYTPVLRVPFGLEDYFDKKIIKLEFNNLDNGISQQKEFYNLLTLFEEKVKYNLKLGDNCFKSNFLKKDNYNPMLIVKVFSKNDRLDCEYKPKEENYLETLYEMSKGVNVKCLLEIGNTWKMKNCQTNIMQGGYILSVKKINVI